MDFLSDTRDQVYSCSINLLFSGMKSIISKLYFSNKSTSYQRKSVDSFPAPRPLRNIGLNCYLNSAFQSIAACPKLVEEMRKLENVYPNANNLIVFNKILTALSDNSKDSLSLPSNEILSNWNRDGEQDTFELLSHIISQVFNELKKIQQKECSNTELTGCSYDLLPLNISMVFKLKCSSYHSSTPNIQTDLAIHLPIPFRITTEELSIEKLMDNYFIEEEITDSKCTYSMCEGKLSKFVTLQKPLPSTLCLHLQRSFWNSHIGTMQKNNERVTFLEKLIIKGKYFSITRNTKFMHGLLFQTFNGLINDKEFSIDGFDCPQNLLVKEKALIGPKSDKITVLDIGYDIYIKELCCASLSADSFSDIQSGVDMDETSTMKVVNENIDGQDFTSIAVSIDDKETIVEQDEIKINNEMYCADDIVTIIDNEKSTPEMCNGNRDELININGKYNDEEYLLKSVIVHFGNAESGHYICHRKCGDRWFCTNDSFVREVSLGEVLNSEAYILMYEKN